MPSVQTKTKEASLHIEAPQKPPREWWERTTKEIKEGNPSYSQEKVDETAGSIWYHKMGPAKKKEETKKSEGSLRVANENVHIPVRIMVSFKTAPTNIRGLCTDISGTMGSGYSGDLQNITCESVNDTTIELSGTFSIGKDYLYNHQGISEEEHVAEYTQEIIAENLGSLYKEYPIDKIDVVWMDATGLKAEGSLRIVAASPLITGMAQAFWATTWADKMDETGHSEAMMSTEITEIMPEVPQKAFMLADELKNEIDAANHIDLDTFIPPGFSGEQLELPEEGKEQTDGLSWSSSDAESFGWYLAMQAMGHGVSWSDSHEDHGLTMPHFDKAYELEDDAEDAIDNEYGVGKRPIDGSLCVKAQEYTIDILRDPNLQEQLETAKEMKEQGYQLVVVHETKSKPREYLYATTADEANNLMNESNSEDTVGWDIYPLDTFLSKYEFGKDMYSLEEGYNVGGKVKKALRVEAQSAEDGAEVAETIDSLKDEAAQLMSKANELENAWKAQDWDFLYSYMGKDKYREIIDISGKGTQTVQAQEQGAPADASLFNPEDIESFIGEVKDQAQSLIDISTALEEAAARNDWETIKQYMESGMIPGVQQAPAAVSSEPVSSAPAIAASLRVQAQIDEDAQQPIGEVPTEEEMLQQLDTMHKQLYDFYIEMRDVAIRSKDPETIRKFDAILEQMRHSVGIKGSSKRVQAIKERVIATRARFEASKMRVEGQKDLAFMFPNLFSSEAKRWIETETKRRAADKARTSASPEQTLAFIDQAAKEVGEQLAQAVSGEIASIISDDTRQKIYDEIAVPQEEILPAAPQIPVGPTVPPQGPAVAAPAPVEASSKTAHMPHALRVAFDKAADFMQPQIEEDDWVMIDGPAGTEWIQDEFVNVNEVQQLIASLESGQQIELKTTSLGQYTENDKAWDIDLRHGFGARMSAPGYLDATPWTVFDTEAEAKAYLASEMEEETGMEEEQPPIDKALPIKEGL